MKPVLSVLSDSEIEVICNAARLILSKKGLRFVDPEVLDVFRRNGFEIADGNVVHIASDQLESALRTAPKRFVRRGASVDRDVALGTGVTHFAVGSLPIFVVERKPAVRRRPAELGDLKRFTQLSEALDAFTIGNPVVQPQEIPEKVMHLLWNRTGSVRMTKPVCCWYGTSRETSEEGLEVLRLAAGGLEQLRAQKRWAMTLCPDSALQWGKIAIGVVVMAPAEVPVEVLPMPFQGSTHPVTMAGALVQSAAEVLGVVVLTQLVRPGCPVLYAASYGGIMDMAMGTHVFGTPESALFGAASTAVGRAFGLPTDMMQGISDSKLPDAQAAMEKAMVLLMPALAGADCITQAGALLDFALSASYEQLVIDSEIVHYVQKIVRGVLVDEATLAQQEIMNLPFGGHFIDSPHTLQHFKKELYFTKLMDRHPWQIWEAGGARDLAERAHLRAEELLAQAKPVQGIPRERQEAVDTFVAEICRKHGVDPEPLLF
jgi:trimethylamine--corrinoid protein Co-methyltransferase